MQYLIWTLSVVFGVGLALAGNPVGWVVFVGGTLAGFIVSRRRAEDRQAAKIAEALRDE